MVAEAVVEKSGHQNHFFTVKFAFLVWAVGVWALYTANFENRFGPVKILEEDGRWNQLRPRARIDGWSGCYEKIG